MVASDLGDLSVTDKIKPRVSDVHVVQRVANQHDRSTSGPHAAQLWMREAMFPHAVVRGPESVVECLLGDAAIVIAVEGRHGLHGKMPGFLSALVAAHAVGHNRQTALA